MDKVHLIHKYKMQENHIPHFRLKDNGIVIGEEIDEQNHLHYVIKRDDTITIEDAQGLRPIEKLIEKKPIIVTKSFKNQKTQE